MSLRLYPGGYPKDDTDLSIFTSCTYNRIVFLSTHTERDATSRNVVGIASVCGRDPDFFSSACRPTNVGSNRRSSLLPSWVRRVGAVPTGRSCENAPGKVSATSVSEVQQKSTIARRRLVSVTRRLGSRDAARRDFLVATWFYPGFIPPSC